MEESCRKNVNKSNFKLKVPITWPPSGPSDSPIGYLEVRVHSAESYLVNTSQSSFQSASGVGVGVDVGVGVFPADLQLALSWQQICVQSNRKESQFIDPKHRRLQRIYTVCVCVCQRERATERACERDQFSCHFHYNNYNISFCVNKIKQNKTFFLWLFAC